MSFAQFTIAFLNNPQCVFIPGQTIQAVVNLSTQQDITVKSIYVKFKGSAHTDWSEGSGDDRRHYSETDKYFKTQICLAGNLDGHTELSLPAGNYSYPINFQLPVGIPSSYEGSHGYVRYLLKAKVDRKKVSDYRVQHPFTVIAMLDLNAYPEAPLPSQLTDTKTSCCLCCEKGPVTTTIRLDKRGFVPGEAIILNAEINNGSGTAIVQSVFKLKLKTTFRAGGNHTSSTVTVTKTNRGRIEPGGSDIWSGERLIVPPTPASYAPGCKLIDLEYFLELKADIEDTMFDIEFQLPVIIGTIPLMQAPPPMYPPIAYPSGVNVEMQQPPPPDPITTQPGAYNGPPPSYEQSVFGTASIQRQRSTDGEKFEDFSPVYPYFNNYQADASAPPPPS